MTKTDQILADIKKNRTVVMGATEVEAVEYIEPTSGIMTGFFDLDYRITGFRNGWYVVFTGETGHGKTTATRQFVMAAMANGVKVFYFIGEESIETESRNLARVRAKNVIKKELLAGRHVYFPSDDDFNEFKGWAKDKVILEPYKNVRDLVDKGIAPTIADAVIDMDMVAAYNNGARFFVLDNMSKLTEGIIGANVFDVQKTIVIKIQRFAQDRNVPVLLITHPNKRGNIVGGVGQITDFADCVLQIKRLDPDNRSIWLRGIADHIAVETSGLIVVSKAREDGMLGKVPLMWDDTTGRLINVTDRYGALQYEKDGWWTHSVAPF